MKLKPQQDMQKYNQKYLELFNEAVRLDRAIDGPNAIYDYIIGLPIENGLFQQVVQLLLFSKMVYW